MTTYYTGNPLGSADARDRFDNSQNMDIAVNSSALTWLDRGPIGIHRVRKTWAGIEADARAAIVSSGFAYTAPLNYQAGIVITLPNQIFMKDGEYYRAGQSIALPYATTGDWATEQPLFVPVGDASLRSALAAPDGISLVGGAFLVVDNYAALLPMTPADNTVINTAGYHAPGDGGAGSYLYRDTTGWRLLHRGTVSAKQFGARGDTSTLDTAAVQTALNTYGVSVVLIGKSEGSYRIGAVTVPSGKTLRGDGTGATIVMADGLAGNVLTLGDSATLEGFYFTGDPLRTSGSFIVLDGRGQKVSNVDINNYHIGVKTNGTIITLSGMQFINAVTSNGSGIRIEGGSDYFIDKIIMDNGGTQPRAAFHMVAGGGVWLSNCDFIHAQNGILLEASGTDTITNFFVDNVACDNCSDAAWHFITYGSGAIRNLRINNSWGATSGTGLLIQAGGGDIDGVFLVNFTSVNNSMHGISLNGKVKNYSHIGGPVAGNSQASPAAYDGIFVGPNIGDITIIGVKAGPGMTFADIQRYQIYVSDGSGYNYNITNNNLDTVQNPLYFGPSDRRNTVGGNSGAVDRGQQIVTTDANGYAIIGHSSGFVPKLVMLNVLNSATPYIAQFDSVTRETFRVRVWNVSGVPLASAAVNISWQVIL